MKTKTIIKSKSPKNKWAKNKWGIKIRSRHTGETVCLGSLYNTIEEAKAAAKRDVCERCNYYDIVPVQDGSIYQNRHIGFLPKDTSSPLPLKKSSKTGIRLHAPNVLTTPVPVPGLRKNPVKILHKV